jgi:ribosome-associated translation inhibitor RaiA
MAEQPWVDRINLGHGVHHSDGPLIEHRLRHLGARLEAWPTSSVDLWLRVKNRDTADMKTTIEVQVPSLPMLRASSRNDDFGTALDHVGDKMVRKLNEAAEKYVDRTKAGSRR